MSEVDEWEWLRLSDDDRQLVRGKMMEDPAWGELITTLKALPAPQRSFLSVYSKSHFDMQTARARYRELTGRTLSTKKLNSWLQDANFQAAVAKSEELVAKAVGISQANVLSSLAEIRNRNMGADDRTAMIALELIGKHLKMWRPPEDQQAGGKQLPAFIVGVQISTPEHSAVDVEFHEVKRD
jgi:hypothetical protein